MEPDELLAELERLAARLGVTIRYEATGGRVGRCLLRGAWIVFVDKNLPLRDKIEALALALADFDYESLYLPEFVRNLLDSRRGRLSSRP